MKEGADGRRANVHAFTTTDIGAVLRSINARATGRAVTVKSVDLYVISSDPTGVSVSCAFLGRCSWANASATQHVNTYWLDPDQRGAEATAFELALNHCGEPKRLANHELSKPSKLSTLTVAVAPSQTVLPPSE